MEVSSQPLCVMANCTSPLLPPSAVFLYLGGFANVLMMVISVLVGIVTAIKLVNRRSAQPPLLPTDHGDINRPVYTLASTSSINSTTSNSPVDPAAILPDPDTAPSNLEKAPVVHNLVAVTNDASEETDLQNNRRRALEDIEKVITRTGTIPKRRMNVIDE